MIAPKLAQRIRTVEAIFRVVSRIVRVRMGIVLSRKNVRIRSQVKTEILRCDIEGWDGRAMAFLK